MVHEYIRNRYLGQQVRERAKGKRGESMPQVEDLGLFCAGMWAKNVRGLEEVNRTVDHTAFSDAQAPNMSPPRLPNAADMLGCEVSRRKPDKIKCRTVTYTR